MKKNKLFAPFVWLLLSAFFLSCASTGPKVSKAERKQKEDEFNAKFLQATETWTPRVYRIAYRLISSHVPGHGEEQPKYNFAGLGVDELKDYARKTYNIDKKVDGVLIRGKFPGSRAENIDVKAGDIILKLDGKKTKSLGAYFKAVRKTKKEELKAEILRGGQTIERSIPIEKVYYNAQFFLAPTPDLDANALFSKINVGIGAIRYCRNDDELAVIMGHELAHTTLHHSLKTMGTGIGTAIGFGVAAAALNSVTYGVGGALTDPMKQAADAAISRRYEREADYFGMRHSFHAGYDVENGSKVFARLATDSPGYNLLAYTFASHPKTSERFLRLEKICEELRAQFPQQAEKVKSPEWEVTVPLSPGESLYEALDRLIKSEKLKAEQVTSSPAAVPAQPATVAASPTVSSSSDVSSRAAA